MGKFLILSVADHEEHILNKIMEALADEPELDHIALPLSDDTLPFPELEIRLKEQAVFCRGQLVTLTHHEFAVLAYLARHPSRQRSERRLEIGSVSKEIILQEKTVLHKRAVFSRRIQAHASFPSLRPY